MKRIIFLLLLTILSKLVFSQVKVDIIISTDIYKSYYSKFLKEPLYVSYKLYKGGGNCSRGEFHFKNDLNSVETATSKDYKASGFDEGHLANAEDFAYDCKKEEETFRFYNCVPQTPNLNRGIWKHWESLIRNESQNDSLLIVCGSIFSNKIIGNNVYVPDYCWKIVKSLSTKKIIYCMLFTNKIDDNVEKDVSLDQLKSLLGYQLIFQ